MTSIKGNNSVINGLKLTPKNPNLNLVNINARAKLGHIPSVRSQDIERKRNYDINHNTCNSVINSRKLTRNNHNLDLFKINP